MPCLYFAKGTRLSIYYENSNMMERLDLKTAENRGYVKAITGRSPYAGGDYYLKLIIRTGRIRITVETPQKETN